MQLLLGLLLGSRFEAIACGTGRSDGTGGSDGPSYIDDMMVHRCWDGPCPCGAGCGGTLNWRTAMCVGLITLMVSDVGSMLRDSCTRDPQRHARKSIRLRRIVSDACPEEFEA